MSFSPCLPIRVTKACCLDNGESMKPSLITTLVIALFACHASATSIGTKDLQIKQIGSRLMACLPEDHDESIALNSAYVVEDDNGPRKFTHQWAIELTPGAKPLVLRPGQCIGFNEAIDGYKRNGDVHDLEPGKTYDFGIRRNDRLDEWVVTRYVGMFCVQENRDGSRSYLPYINHPGGYATYPVCGRYIGRAPSPDGIVPPDMPRR